MPWHSNWSGRPIRTSPRTCTRHPVDETMLVRPLFVIGHRVVGGSEPRNKGLTFRMQHVVSDASQFFRPLAIPLHPILRAALVARHDPVRAMIEWVHVTPPPLLGKQTAPVARRSYLFTG